MSNIRVGYTRTSPAKVEKGVTSVVGPQGPQGEIGPPGPQGDPGVVVSAAPPANTNLIWVDDS